ncbi:MAG TPA: glycosyltransferase family 39 protein [Xanthobacteraceae bacterium]|nr:glycosyltransferase family 39 protein [Xanthobacteraceae bacterium]
MRFTSLTVELIRARPRLMFWIVALAQCALWVAVPMIAYGSPPGDVAQVLNFGREYQVGIAAGPPLAFWLADIAFRLAGGHIIGVYVLAQLCVIAGYWAVFSLARQIVGPPHAVLAVLLTATISYFSFSAVAFGPDQLAMPLWALLLLMVWRVIGQGRRNAWFALSIIAGLLALATSAAGCLLALVVLFAVATRHGRRALASIDPLLALIVIAALALPYLVWQARTGTLVLGWPQMVALQSLPKIRPLLTQWGWTLAIVGAGLAGLVILVIATKLRAGPETDRKAPAIERSGIAPFARRFVLFFAIVPPLAGTLVAQLRGDSGVVGAGTLLIMAGLAAVVLMGDVVRLRRPAVLRTVWIAAVAAPAIAVVVVALVHPWTGGRELETSLPARAIGKFFGENFERRTGQPLPLVAGDPQLAMLIGMAAPSRPRVLLDATPERTPWLSREDIVQKGGVVVWRATDTVGAPPPEIAARYPGLIAELPRLFDRLVDGRLPPLRIGWAILRPAGAPDKP